MVYAVGLKGSLSYYPPTGIDYPLKLYPTALRARSFCCNMGKSYNPRMPYFSNWHGRRSNAEEGIYRSCSYLMYHQGIRKRDPQSEDPGVVVIGDFI